VRGEARAASSFRPPPHRLSERAQRPGELADLLVVEVEDNTREHAEALAARAALPLPLIAVIAVESERALTEVVSAAGLDRDALIGALDAEAATAPTVCFDAPPTRRLRSYAAALRSGGYPGSRAATRALELVVPHRLLGCWSVAAQDSACTLDAWFAETLALATPGRELWESSAAALGQTLAEWVALQALSRARRSSSAAHAMASA
jgi:hypothetical protein